MFVPHKSSKYIPSRKGVTLPIHLSPPFSSHPSTNGSEYCVYHKRVEPARLHLSDPCSNGSERLILGGVSTGLEPEEIAAQYADEYEDKNQDPHSGLLFQGNVGAAL